MQHLVWMAGTVYQSESIGTASVAPAAPAYHRLRFEMLEIGFLHGALFLAFQRVQAIIG